MVISDKWFDIKNHVLNNMERGVTILEGKGGYTNESKPVLMIVIPQKNVFEFRTRNHAVRSKSFYYCK